MIFKDIDLNRLLQLMQNNGVSEMNLRDGKIAIEVKMGTPPSFSLVNQTHPTNLEQVQVESRQGSHESNSLIIEKMPEKINLQEECHQTNLHKIAAPLVGTFYRAAGSELEPFVEVGDPVKNGDVLCIVEAMKSMNEIQSDVDGVIKEICVRNSDLVEFEQVLFKIEPND